MPSWHFSTLAECGARLAKPTNSRRFWHRIHAMTQPVEFFNRPLSRARTMVAPRQAILKARESAFERERAPSLRTSSEIPHRLSVPDVAQNLPGQQGDVVANETHRTVGQADVHATGVQAA